MMATQPGFRVTVDLARGFFETAMSGFWTLETMADFHRALQNAVARIRATGRGPVSLCDYSGGMVQSQEVVAGFMAMMTDPAVRSRRVAVCTDGALPGMQIERANRDNAEFRYSTDKDAARAWLFSADDAA